MTTTKKKRKYSKVNTRSDKKENMDIKSKN